MTLYHPKLIIAQIPMKTPRHQIGPLARDLSDLRGRREEGGRKREDCNKLVLGSVLLGNDYYYPFLFIAYIYFN